MNCSVCGSPLPSFTFGRPRLYCCQNCQLIGKYINELEKKLILISPNDASKKLLAGDLFRLANIVSNGTKSSRLSKTKDFN